MCCAYAHVQHACLSLQMSENASDPLELELSAIVSCHASAGSQTRVLRETIKYSQTAKPSLQPCVFFFFFMVTNM